jgi:hypothetical protein
MSCKKSTDKKRMDRLLDREFTLNTIHKIRWGLLQLTHDIKSEDEKTYDDDFYVEANEILNEVEKRVK